MSPAGDKRQVCMECAVHLAVGASRCTCGRPLPSRPGSDGVAAALLGATRPLNDDGAPLGAPS